MIPERTASVPQIPHSLSVAADLIKRREMSALELTQSVLERIEKIDPVLKSYITVLSEDALESARLADMEIARGGYRGPLHGIPVSVKDTVFTKGIRTTVGTSILADHVPDHDAVVVERLREAGAILLGKNNMHEFALGITNANPHYGDCLNPWSLNHVPGGSSGGSAAAVAAGLAMGAIGGDSGGSIRIPAAYTNLVGLKPTNGLIPRYGLFTGTWTLDSAGPITRTVRDNAMVLSAIAGHDARDRRSLNVAPTDYSTSLGSLDPKTLRIGIPREFYFERSLPELSAAVMKGAQVFADMGARLVDVSLPNSSVTVDAGAVISWSEYAVSQEAIIRDSRQAFGQDVRALLELSSTHLATHYIKAQQARTVVMDEYWEVWKQVDVVLTPTTPVPPPHVGEQVHLLVALLTRAASMTAEPAISLPCGFTEAGLPIGMHLQAPLLREKLLYQVSHLYEQATDWHRRLPEVDSLPDKAR